MRWDRARWLIPLAAAVMAAGPALLNPLLPRDAPAHAFGAEYAWEILTGRAPSDLCPYWYMGFPYTTFYCFLPYYLIAPLAKVLGGPYAFAVGLVLAAGLFNLGVYALARRLGFVRSAAWACVLGAAGMSFEWVLGGIYPMTLSLGFGLLALAMRDRRVLSPILLALSLYSHPLGGTLSSLVTLLWSAFEGRWKGVTTVAIAWLLAAPHYAFLLPYIRWLSPLLDAPASMLELLIPGLRSPGIFLLTLGGLGLWKVRREPWAKTVIVCWGLAWGLAAVYALGMADRLPFGRNLLLDRFTCALLTPLLAVSACYALKDGSRLVRTLLALSLIPVVIPWLVAGTTPMAIVPGSKGAWGWVAEHRPHDPLVRVEPGPFFRGWTELYGAAHNALWVGPRFTGNFAQGDPYFHALTERAEWELFWWYDPEFVRTVCRLCNIQYLVTVLPSVVDAGRRAGLTPVHRSGRVIVLENHRIAGAEAVDPIGVYDPRPDARELVKEYTTALNLIPRRGYQYAFAIVRRPKDLQEFRKVLIRPRSPEDVRLALRLAREGKHVLLVLPVGNDRIAQGLSRELHVHFKRAELEPRPEYPDVRDQVRVWKLTIGSRLPIDPSRVAPKYRPIRPRALPAVYKVDGSWWRDVRVGRGTIRVVGIDLPITAIRLHPTLLNSGTRIPPLPGSHERALFSEVLRGFGSELHPVPCRFDLRSTRTVIFPKGNKWVLVKLKHFPAWHAHGGKILVGPGGTMIVRADSPRVTLRFTFPPYLYALGAIGLASGLLALALLWIGSEGKGGGWVRSMIGNLRESQRTTRRRQHSAGHRELDPTSGSGRRTR